MSTNHLYDALFETQRGGCAICQEVLTTRYLTRVDRFPVRGEDGGKYVPENVRLICLECDWEQEGNRPASPHPEIVTAYRTYKMFQTEHGRFDRKLRAYDGDIRGTTASPYFNAALLDECVAARDNFGELTKQAEREMVSLVRQAGEWNDFMKAAPGIGEVLAGFLLGKIDIKKADTVSSLWQFLGYGDPNEPYNPGKGSMKAALYAALSISVCTRKASPYRRIYDNYRAKEISHGGAIRRVIKLWLSHLWATWRAWSELPVSEPYANNHLGHDGFYDPAEFGWETING